MVNYKNPNSCTGFSLTINKRKTNDTGLISRTTVDNKDTEFIDFNHHVLVKDIGITSFYKDEKL
jgi:hypothetical protein